MKNCEIYFERKKGYTYAVTTGQRKAWDGDPDLSKDGWEYVNFERFDYHEEKLWRKRTKDLNDDEDKEIIDSYEV